MAGTNKLELARKAIALMLLGLEPKLNESLEDYVKRGEEYAAKLAVEEEMLIDQEA